MASTSARTLLLNSTYEPLKVITWQRAVTLLWLGKVEVIRHYDRDIRSVTFKIRMPAVVRLLRFIRRKRQQISFSRKNLFARDDNSCQYCGQKRDSSELTYDHVVPRSLGGKTDWQNIVTCCIACNRRKGGRTPEQAGMRLLRHPRRPEKLPGVLTITIGLSSAPDAWRDFLYWNVQLDED
jgi:5-methylcytosine-specific restriction endonuclease McrA